MTDGNSITNSVAQWMTFGGYIAYDAEGCIWGVGDTSDAARMDAYANMEAGSSGQDADLLPSVQIMPATERLLDKVDRDGGSIRWWRVGDLADVIEYGKL